MLESLPFHEPSEGKAFLMNPAPGKSERNESVAHIMHHFWGAAYETVGLPGAGGKPSGQLLEIRFPTPFFSGENILNVKKRQFSGQLMEFGIQKSSIPGLVEPEQGHPDLLPVQVHLPEHAQKGGDPHTPGDKQIFFGPGTGQRGKETKGSVQGDGISRAEQVDFLGPVPGSPDKELKPGITARGRGQGEGMFFPGDLSGMKGDKDELTGCIGQGLV